MGVQASMTIEQKPKAVAINLGEPGLGTFPIAGDVSIISLPAILDEHRLADIQRAVVICLDFARDNNLFTSAVSVAVLTTLNGGKNTVRTETLASAAVTGDVGLLIVGTVRAVGDTHIVDGAHKQLLQFMREEGRLAA